LDAPRASPAPTVDERPDEVFRTMCLRRRSPRRRLDPSLPRIRFRRAGPPSHTAPEGKAAPPRRDHLEVRRTPGRRDRGAVRPLERNGSRGDRTRMNGRSRIAPASSRPKSCQAGRRVSGARASRLSMSTVRFPRALRGRRSRRARRRRRAPRRPREGSAFIPSRRPGSAAAAPPEGHHLPRAWTPRRSAPPRSAPRSLVERLERRRSTSAWIEGRSAATCQRRRGP